MKLSVIVPCFNCVSFIKECLSSLLFHIPTGVEIVFVDDGSTDGSLVFVREEFKKEIASETLRVVSQENKGLSVARNTGVYHAKGDYISFVDSDDSVSVGFYSEIFIALNDEPDIIEFNITRYRDGVAGDIPVWIHNRQGLFKMEDVRMSVFQSGHWFACARVYKKNLISQYKFPAEKYFEDVMTIPFVYLENVFIFYIQSNIYRYRINPKGISGNIKEKHYIDLFEFYKSIESRDEVELSLLKIQTLKMLSDFAAKLDSKIDRFRRIRSELKKIEVFSRFVLWRSNYFNFYCAPRFYFSAKTLRNLLTRALGIYRK